MRRFVLACSPVLLTAVLAASGCGSSNAVDPAVVAKAADTTTKAGVARMALTVQAQGQTLHGQGATDPKTGRAQVTLNLPNGQGAIETRYIAGAMYLHLPAQARKDMPSGKEWAKIDMTRVMRAQGIDVSKVQGQSGNNPDQQLQQLRGAGQVKRVGTETVRGAKTTHYKATVDARKAAERLAAGDKAAARTGMAKLLKAGGARSTIPVEVWIDDQGRVRRMRMAQRIQNVDTTETMELYDFGSDQAIVEPSSDKTADITDQTLKQLGG